MRNQLLAAALLLTFAVPAQEKEQETKRDKSVFMMDWGMKAYLFQPIQFGDHALAKAHDAELGFGANLNLFSYGDFRFYAGFDLVKYLVTDHQIIGNYRNSNYRSFYVAVSYDAEVTPKFHLFPVLGVGDAALSFRDTGTSFGHQDGTEYRFGLTGNYYLTKNCSLFLGAHFIHNTFDIHTNEDFHSFFGSADQMQLSFGVQID